MKIAVIIVMVAWFSFWNDYSERRVQRELEEQRQEQVEQEQTQND